MNSRGELESRLRVCIGVTRVRVADDVRQRANYRTRDLAREHSADNFYTDMGRQPYSVRILAPAVFAGALEGVLLNCPVLEYHDVPDNKALPPWLLKRIAEGVGCDWQTLRGLVDAKRTRMHHSTWLGIQDLAYCYISLAQDYLEEIARARKAREAEDARRQRDGKGVSFGVNSKAEAEAVAWERVAENAIASCEYLLDSAALDLEIPTPEALAIGGAHSNRVAGRRSRTSRRRAAHK